MQIEYCEECQSRITEHDLDVGQAVKIGVLVYCKACQDRLGLRAPAPIIAVSPRKGASSGRHRALGSGTRKGTSPGSGVRRAAQPGSGVRKRASPGSGLRRAVSPSSGVRKAPTSGILRAAGTPARETPGRGQRGRGRWRALQAKRGGSKGTGLWTSLLGVVVGIIIVIGIYFFLNQQ